MSWTFEKVGIDLLDNLNLNSHEKLLYILICRFKIVKLASILQIIIY
jgi:hypothetical protein